MNAHKPRLLLLITIFFLSLLYIASIKTLVLINTSPSVALGIYIRTRSLQKAQYVAFYGKTVQRQEYKLIKKFIMLPNQKIYVYGSHPHSLTSEHIGLLSTNEVIPMNKL